MTRALWLAAATSIGFLVTLTAPRETHARGRSHDTVVSVGLGTFGVAWLLPAVGVLYARFPNNSYGLLLPVAGPWITLYVREDVPEPLNGFVKGTLVTLGILQAGGLVVAGIGALPVYGRSHAATDKRLFVAPVVGADGSAGVHLGGRF